MNEDNLNMEIRKFLKKVGITSQRIIEKERSVRNASNRLAIGCNRYVRTVRVYYRYNTYIYR